MTVTLDNTPTTALELDDNLRAHIKDYLSIKGNNTRTLPEDISDHIKSLYVNLTTHESAAISPEKLAEDINKNTPSRTLLMDYYRDGSPMCTRYINALALFFEQEYTVSQYNPARDLSDRIKSNKLIKQ